MAKTKGPAELQPGDMLRIPYGDAAVYGRVIRSDPRGTPKGKGRGLYMKVLDRDVAPGADLREVAAAPVLLGPFQTVDLPVREGKWEVLGNVPTTPQEADLPYFLDRTGVVDYFYERVPDTPQSRQRVVTERVVPPDMIVDAVSAKRGKGEWYPGYDMLLAQRG